MTQTTAEQTTAPAATPETAPAHFSTPRRPLVDAVNLTALAIPVRPPVPVLGGVLVESTPGAVTLHAHDFQVTVSVTLPAEPASTGRSVLNHTVLKQVLAAVAAGESKAVADRMPVTVASEILSTPDVAVPLNAYPEQEYPELPAPAAPQISVDSEAFLGQLARVLPAAGTDLTLPVLTCVQFTLTSGSLSMLATDRYRLAHAELPVTRMQTGKPFRSVEALIPADVLDKVAKQMRRHSGNVGIGVTTEPNIGVTLVTFTFADVRISVRPTDGALPKHKTLMPSGAHLSVTLDRAATVKAAKKAVALAKAKASGLAFCLLDSGSPDTVSLAPYYGEEDRSRVRGVSLPATLAKGTPGDLAAASVVFNARYLLEALATFTGDSITVHQQEPGSTGRGVKPVLLTDGPTLAGEGYLHLLMPIRPND